MCMCTYLYTCVCVLDAQRNDVVAAFISGAQFVRRECIFFICKYCGMLNV